MFSVRKTGIRVSDLRISEEESKVLEEKKSRNNLCLIHFMIDTEILNSL